EDLALPAAIRAGVGAEIVEEGVAAEDAALIEQHDAGQSTVDTIKRTQMDGIQAIDCAALANSAFDRQGLLLDRRHHGLKGNVGQFAQAALEAIEVSIGLATREQ